MQKQVEALGVKLAEVRERPRRSTDKAATMSTSRRDGCEQPIEARALVAAFGAGDAGVPSKNSTCAAGPTRGPGVDVPGAVQSGSKS
jgi:hypothetical protein